MTDGDLAEQRDILGRTSKHRPRRLLLRRRMAFRMLAAQVQRVRVDNAEFRRSLLLMS